ncbi:nuclear pore complex protein DDB_G0274915-like [Panonychus citri]|uniref:nuclear pore complex protein DDB_G0274915-like n=1 Tax=Panonychus citri TaxID=50023 RepID=UPI00230769BA|nr:nuclear pore complex protein DDB_G0274915-like [Panonychus citri]
MTTPILNQSKSDNNGDQKQKYRSLKKRLKVLIYENECFQEELRKCQKELIAIKCDEYFLLDKLLKYEDIQSTSSSDSDATDYSESEIDVKPLKPKSTAKRLKTNNGSISQNTESTPSPGGPLKRKKTKSKGTIPIASQKSLITYGASHRNKDGISRGKKANESESTSSTSSTVTPETPMVVTQMIPTTTQTVTGPSSSSSSSSSGFLNINSLVPNLSVPVSIGNSFYIATTPSTPCTTVPTKSSATCNQSSLLMAESITSSTTGPTASLLRPNLKVTTTPSSSISSTTANSMLKFAPLIQTTKLPSILSASKSSGLSLSVPLKPSSSPMSTGNLKFSTKSATATKLSTPTSSLHTQQQQQQQPLPSLSLSSPSSSTVSTSTTIPVSTGTISTIPFTCKLESKSISQTSKSTNQLTESTKTVVATKPTMSPMVTCKTESMPLIRTAKIPSILLISSTSASSSLPSTLTVAKTANSKTTTSTFTLQTESKSSIRTSNKTPSILLASKISGSSSSSSSSSLSLPISSSFSTITTLAPTTTKVSSSLSSTTSTTTTPKSESNLTSGWYLLTQPINTSESPSILSTQEATNGGHFTLEEIERHFESRPIQSSLLLPEKTPLTLPSELFSND